MHRASSFSRSRRLSLSTPGGALPGAALVAAALVGALQMPGSARADYIDHFATKADVGIHKIPSVGTTRVLVLPVIVDNVPFTQGSEEAFLAELDAFFTVDDNTVFAGGFTFTAWWEQASLGSFRPEAVIASPVRFPSCPPLGAYDNCQIPRGAGLPDGDVQGALAVLRDALRFMDEILLCASEGAGGGKRCTEGGGVDFSAFDTTGLVPGQPDGFVDGVLLVSNAGFPGIALPIKDLATQPLLQFLGPFSSFEYDGVVVPSVGIAGRTGPPGQMSYVALHEFGHLLGYCDLYNEAGTTIDLPYTMMGGWFYDEPASLPDPFSRLAIGWGNVTQVAGDAVTLRLPTASRSGAVLKVGTGSEFFLVEHRRKEEGATDGDLQTDHGVLVLRVDLAKRPSPDPGQYFNTLANCVNCTPFGSMLMVEEADGEYALQKNRRRDDDAALFAAGDSVGPSGDTRPRNLQNPVFSTNLLSGAPTGITIEVLTLDADSAELRVTAPPVADGCRELLGLCGERPCVVGSDGLARCEAPVPPRLGFPVEPESPEPEGPGCPCSAGGPGGGRVDLALALLPLGLGAFLGARRRRRAAVKAA